MFHTIYPAFTSPPTIIEAAFGCHSPYYNTRGRKRIPKNARGCRRRQGNAREVEEEARGCKMNAREGMGMQRITQRW